MWYDALHLNSDLVGCVCTVFKCIKFYMREIEDTYTSCYIYIHKIQFMLVTEIEINFYQCNDRIYTHNGHAKKASLSGKYY